MASLLIVPFLLLALQKTVHLCMELPVCRAQLVSALGCSCTLICTQRRAEFDRPFVAQFTHHQSTSVARSFGTVEASPPQGNLDTAVTSLEELLLRTVMALDPNSVSHQLGSRTNTSSIIILYVHTHPHTHRTRIMWLVTASLLHLGIRGFNALAYFPLLENTMPLVHPQLM